MSYTSHAELESQSKILYQSAPFLPLALAVHEVPTDELFRPIDITDFTGLVETQTVRVLGKLTRLGVVTDTMPGRMYGHGPRYFRNDLPAWKSFTVWYDILDIGPADLFNPSWEYFSPSR